MYTLLRIWSAAVIVLMAAYLVLLAFLSLLGGDFMGLLGATGMFLGFVSFDRSVFDACVASESDPACEAALDSIVQIAAGATPSTVVYLLATLATAVLVYTAARGLERWRIAELVRRKLGEVDSVYVSRILGIRDFDRAGIGTGADGVEYMQDVLALEATGGRGDARHSGRSAAAMRRSAERFTKKVSLYERWRPYYEDYSHPGLGDSLVLAWRVWTIIFLVAATWFATFSTDGWAVPLLVGLGAIVAVYMPDDRWKRVYAQSAGNETNMFLFVVFAVVLSAVGYVASVVIGFLFGSRVFAAQWLPYLGVFLWIAVALAVLVPLSNYAVVRHQMHARADEAVDALFRKRLARAVHGTHAFAVCESCGTPAVLELQETRDCESCGRPVDMSMSVRAVHV